MDFRRLKFEVFSYFLFPEVVYHIDRMELLAYHTYADCVQLVDLDIIHMYLRTPGALKKLIKPIIDFSLCASIMLRLAMLHICTYALPYHVFIILQWPDHIESINA